MGSSVAAYDVAWWREHWKRTRVQGVIINAGGIFAYYPSRNPLLYRPPALGDRDLYGELAKAAHDDGLAVFARMDSNRTHEGLYRAHPDWFAVDATGKPYRAGELYVTCVNGPYYEEYIPSILREIIERSHPEAVTDNTWSGLDRESICYCRNCTKKFGERTGKPIPTEKNWDEPAYRQWIQGEVAANTPYDTFVRKILTSTGSNKDHPAASYFKILRTPQETMETTTHLFLAVRFNCNKCHDHSFERWTQDQ